MAVHQNPKGFFWWEVRLLLRMLSFFYYIGIKLRLCLYWVGIFRARKLPAYVISVGNLTVGGTGKTPFVLYLAERLSKSNKVGILARGYGSDAKVSEDDENMALPANVIRATNPDRVSAGEKLIKEQGVQTIILDDGFQHLALRRDVDIVLIDATNPFGKGRLMPAGILREPQASLKRADIFVLTHVDLVTPEQLNALEQKLRKYNKKIVNAIHKPQYLVDMARPDKTIDLSAIKDKNIWEFCGIGNPFQFHKTLNALCNIKGLSVFPDHY
ncbi:MAG: tetraacyldisaccharide 4'-kinase, partial [Planctomycetota bacterium]